MPDRRVRVYPTEGAFIDGVPAREMVVDPKWGEQLLAYSPPAFTTTRPAGQSAPSDDALEIGAEGFPAGPADLRPEAEPTPVAAVPTTRPDEPLPDAPLAAPTGPPAEPSSDGTSR